MLAILLLATLGQTPVDGMCHPRPGAGPGWVFPNESKVVLHLVAKNFTNGASTLVPTIGPTLTVAGAPLDTTSSACMYAGLPELGSFSNSNYFSLPPGNALASGADWFSAFSFTPVVSSSTQSLINNGLYGSSPDAGGWEVDLNNITPGQVEVLVTGPGGTYQPLDIGAYVAGQLNVGVVGRQGTNLFGQLNGGPVLWTPNTLNSVQPTASSVEFRIGVGRGDPPTPGSPFLGKIQEVYISTASPPSAFAYTSSPFNGCVGIGAPVLWANSANADGSGDGTLTNGQALSSIAHGSGGTALTQTNGALYQAMFLGGPFGDGLGAINFNGLYNTFILPGSQSYEASVFDAFFLYRTAQPSKHFLVDSFYDGTGTASGFGVEVGDDGHIFAGIEQSGVFLAQLNTESGFEKHGPWNMIEARSDGQNLCLSRDLFTYECVATGPAVITYTSINNWIVGGITSPIFSLPISPANLNPANFQGDLLDARVYARMLTPYERSVIRATYLRRGPPSDAPAILTQIGDSTNELGGQGGLGDASTTISLSTMLERDHGPGVLVDNQAIGNTTSTQELAWWESNVRSSVPAGGVLLLGGGINDLGQSIPPATTRSNLKTIEGEALDAGARIIYETWNPISNAPPFDAGFFQPTVDAQRAFMLGEANGVTIFVSDNYFLLGDGGTFMWPAYAAPDKVHQLGTGNAVEEVSVRAICADAGLPCN